MNKTIPIKIEVTEYHYTVDRDLNGTYHVKIRKVTNGTAAPWKTFLSTGSLPYMLSEVTKLVKQGYKLIA